MSSAADFDLSLARSQAVGEAQRCLSWLEGQRNDAELDSDGQLDSFIRAWRKLPDRPAGHPPYRGLGFGRPSSPRVARLRWNGGRDKWGFRLLTLSMSGRAFTLISGGPRNQAGPFVHPSVDKPGSQEAIPEGVYSIGKIERTNGSWGPGIGPIWIPLTAVPQFKLNNRNAFGLHVDWNRNSPGQTDNPGTDEGLMGSAGCPVTYTLESMEAIAQAITADQIEYLVVDWGFGLVKDWQPAGRPAAPSPQFLPDFKFDRDNSVKAVREQCAALKLDRNSTAYILATADHETDGFRTLEEYSSGYQYEGRRDLGNTRQGDGPRFKGRGYVQLTGRRNYTLYSELTGLDLVGSPQILVERPAVSVWVLVDGMTQGRFTGQRLGRYVGLHRKDFIGARFTVNGNDRAARIAALAESYLKSV